MDQQRKPWRLRVGKYARVFVAEPKTPWTYVYLLLRGYRKHAYFNHWWAKPNKHQRDI